jgi:hypothetical protein
MVEFPFAFNGWIERELAPIRQRIPKLNRITVMMPAPFACIFLEILVMILEIDLEPVRKAQFDFLLQQMFRPALSGKRGVQAEFSLNLPRWLDVDAGCSEPPSSRPFRLLVRPERSVFRKTVCAYHNRLLKPRDIRISPRLCAAQCRQANCAECQNLP